MATTTLASRSATNSGWTTKHTGIAGIAFAILFVAGMVLMGGTPDYTAADAEWTSWYEDSGNTRSALAGTFLVLFGVVALVGFVGGLVQRMRQDSERLDAMHIVTLAGGVIMSVALMVGSAVIVAAAGAIEFTDFPVPNADVLKMTEQMGYGILLLGTGVGACLLLGGASLVSRRTNMFPTWLAIAGLAAAVILLFLSAMFIPIVLIPLWAIAASIAARLRGPKRWPAS